jgi:hypothetical protein
MTDMSKPGKVIYIAGPMSGTEDLGRARFAAMEKRLRERGYAVLNPACLPTDLPEERYMPICLAMLHASDMVMMLDGWTGSFGASMERDFAMRCGRTVVYERDREW